MEKKTARAILLEIFNETLESQLRSKINLKTYEEIPDDEQIVPQELVDAGMRQPKTAGTRKKEIYEEIKTKGKMIKIIEKMIDDEETQDEKLSDKHRGHKRGGKKKDKKGGNRKEA